MDSNEHEFFGMDFKRFHFSRITESYVRLDLNAFNSCQFVKFVSHFLIASKRQGLIKLCSLHPNGLLLFVFIRVHSWLTNLRKLDGLLIRYRFVCDQDRRGIS